MIGEPNIGVDVQSAIHIIGAMIGERQRNRPPILQPLVTVKRIGHQADKIGAQINRLPDPPVTTQLVLPVVGKRNSNGATVCNMRLLAWAR